MKKIYALFVLLSATAIVIAQCDPESFDWMGEEFGIDPNAENGDTFNSGELGVAYADVIYLNIPSSASQINADFPDFPIDSVVLDNIFFTTAEGTTYELDDIGLTLTCNNLGLITTECGFAGGQVGCATLDGTPLIAGEFTTSVNAVVYVTVAGNPFPYAFPYEGYTFTIINPNSVPVLEGNSFELLQNTPNPADKSTRIEVAAKSAGEATIEVVNMLGEVMMKRNLKLKSGLNKLDVNTSTMPSGIYFYRFNSDGKTKTQRMIVSH